MKRGMILPGGAMMLPLAWIWLAACGGGRLEGTTCACNGHGVQRCQGADCGPCMCLPFAEPEPDPSFEAEFWVDAGGRGDGTQAHPWGHVQWPAVDAALANGDVAVWFSARSASGAEDFDDRLEILRTDTGPHRVVLDGRTWWRRSGTWRPNNTLVRARFAGASTTEAPVKRSRVTLRGFELADSHAQGVFWIGGDDVVLEDLDVHDNQASPAILFEYASRSGLPSTGITLRSTHVHEARGECVYIGGAEGTGGPSHADLLVESNLIHGCGTDPINGHQWDGLNVKDGIRGVEITGNVIFDAHWGIEVGSPADIHDNLVFDVADDGVHLADQWGDGHDGTILRELAVLDAGGHGIRVGADENGATGLVLENVVVSGSHGDDLRLAGDQGITGTATGVWLLGDSPIEGWGDVDVTFTDCAITQAATGWLAPCDVLATAQIPIEAPAGPDGVFFTEDDPWRLGPLAP